MTPGLSFKGGRPVTRKMLGALGVLAVIGLVVGGIAFATIPDSSGVIHGCYSKNNGALRVIDDSVSQCSNKENALNWNARGTSHAYHASDPTVIALSTTPTTILSLNLPAGSYVVVGKTNTFGLVNYNVSCTLDAASQLDQTFVNADDQRASLSLESSLVLASSGAVSMNCTSDTAGVSNSQLVAIAVDVVN
jgi:hypothetical protein